MTVTVERSKGDLEAKMDSKSMYDVRVVPFANKAGAQPGRSRSQ